MLKSLALTLALLAFPLWYSPLAAARTKAPLGIVIGQGNAKLPTPVAEMRDAILAAVQTGELDELLIPIQWNELPPDFGDLSIEQTLSKWKKSSADGSGSEWLTLLAKLLASPYAVVRQGRDVENANIYIWPAFAELPFKKLTPELTADLNRLLPKKEVARMKSLGRYDGYALAIGADGTWHAFKKVTPHNELK